jgi:2-polyprenyl-3-methyl-5-hydroxy-6-metoxy-1,4-benzoquinol methylase
MAHVTAGSSVCPMCGAPGQLFVEAFGDALHRCSACALIYLFPFPSQTDMIRRHQTEAYAAHPYFAAGGDAAATLDGFALHRRFLAMLERHLPAGSRVLDVGAGTGEFVELASAKFQMSAVEPSPFLAARIRQRAAACDVFEGAFEDLVPAAPFDAVLLMDIIEHSADPRLLLRQAAAVLKPGGLLFVCTVDSRALLYRLGPLTWRAARVSAAARYVLHRIFCQQHNWYFNRRVLGQVVRDAGFTVLDHQGYEFPLDRLRESPIVIAGLRVVYGAQKLLGANSEQFLLARKPA